MSERLGQLLFLSTARMKRLGARTIGHLAEVPKETMRQAEASQQLYEQDAVVLPFPERPRPDDEVST